MVRYERMVNDVDLTLNGSINAAVTTITVNDGSVLPSDGDFRMLIEDELVLVTGRTVNDLTVERGAESTTAASHADSTAITPVLTAAAIDQMLDDVTGGWTDRYPMRLVDIDGDTLTSSDFTWVNQGTAGITDDTWGGMTMDIPNQSSDNHRILKKSAPSTPYTLTAFMLFGPGYNDGGGSNSSYGALGVRESDTGKLAHIECRIGGDCRTRRYNSPTSYNSEQDVQDFSSDRMWLQIYDDGTSLFFRISSDGINFFETANYLRGAFMTSNGPDEIYFAWNSSGGEDDQLCHLLAWIEE